MKTQWRKWAFAFAITMFFTQLGNSQTYKNDDSASKGNVTTSEVMQLNPNLLNNLGISTAPSIRNAQISGNSVLLRQIGDENNASIFTQTNASEIKLLQNGDANNVLLDYTANTVVSNLIQNGDNNRIIDYVNDPQADVSLNLLQQGNSMNFEREGINDLTKSIKFIQTEATPNIIIRSIN